MQKIISFIIPSYNVAQYLKTAVGSMVQPDCLDRIEIIIVNDGSQDGTRELAEEYCRRYEGSVFLINKPNGGHGSAINAGVGQAQGKYFKVIDADDWIVSENLLPLLNILEQCQADVVLTPFHQVNLSDRKREAWRMYCGEYETNYSLSQVMSSYKSFDRCLTFHGIMYRTEFYRQQGHLLPEKVFYEDQEFAAIPLCRAKTVFPVSLYFYQYLVGNAQQSVDPANRVKRIGHIEQVAADILAYAAGHPELDQAARELLLKKAEGVILSYYVTACLFQPDKAKGLEQARQFSRRMFQMEPAIRERVYKKYRLYCLMARLRIPYSAYERVIRSRLYSIVRKTHRIEKE